ncbi:MAG: acyltransferase domain-containing protein [Lentisphaeria bacterium]|nr:acyltransferase domain-containing protein [Lentisphaeria bacterium]
MNVEQLQAALGFDSFDAFWLNDLDLDVGANRQLIEPYIQAPFLKKWTQSLGFDESACSAVFDNVSLLMESDALIVWLGNIIRRCFTQECEGLSKMSSLPHFKDSHIPHGNMVYAYFMLAGCPYLKNRHEAKNISSQITIDTLRDIKIWMDDYYSQNGFWGLTCMGWISRHLREEIYRIGRLQFEQGIYDFEFEAYIHKKKNTVIVLAHDGVVFREDGQWEDANGHTDASKNWRATLTETQLEFSGFPISQNGYAVNKRVSLCKKEWSRALKNGDPVIKVHIPADGSMTYADCGDSFMQAKTFYKTVQPYPFKAFTCGSWLLDYQLSKYMHSESNVVKFLMEHYLIPLKFANEKQTYYIVFGDSKVDVMAAITKTSLQKAIRKLVEDGGICRSAGGLIFPSLLNWGKAPYRLTDPLNDIT